MIQSNLEFRLKWNISSALSTGGTFNISEDLELKAPINTDGKVVSIVLSNTRQIERMTVTILNSVCTIVKRGISQNGGVEIAGLKKAWLEWTGGYITMLDFDLIDKDGESQVISAPMVFNSSADFDGKLNVPEFANTTARDLVYTSPVDGDICFITGDGLQVYNGWAWGTLGVATPTSNASTTVSGKVEEAEDSEFTAGTSTGGTGAKLFASLVQLAKSILLKPTITSTTNADYFTVNQGWLDRKITQENIREQLAWSTTQKGTFEMATDGEVVTGTDQVRVINPKQLNDKFVNVFNVTPNWIPMAISNGGSTTNTSYVPLAWFLFPYAGTYRLAFLLHWDGGVGTATYEVRVNGVWSIGSNTVSTGLVLGTEISYDNGTILDNGTYSKLFWESSPTGWDADKFYADYTVGAGGQIIIFWKNVGDDARISRVEVMGTLTLYPQVTM